MATTVRSERMRSGQLLEREGALDELMASLSETRTGTGRLVIVSGEAGIGKTALVRAFCESVRSSDQILEGACDPLFTPRPLGPFADVAARTGGALAELVERGAGAHEVLAAIRDVLQAHPTVLVLEDMHWADEATLDVVRMLGRRIDGLPALVILTYRDDELDRSHPLRLVLGELATGRGVVRVPLRSLSPEAVAELAHGSGIDSGELYRRTTGNPFYVSEVLAGGGDEIPPTVRDAVFARVARLSTSAVAVVEAVSIAPPHVEPWLLQAMCGDSVDADDECLTSGILVTVDGGTAFRHELARLAVEESLAPTRRVSLHRDVLRALTRRVPLDPTRLAHHAEAAGDTQAVLEYAPMAAERAAPPARTGRQRPSTDARSASRTICRRAGAQSCSSAAPRPATSPTTRSRPSRCSARQSNAGAWRERPEVVRTHSPDSRGTSSAAVSTTKRKRRRTRRPRSQKTSRRAPS